jgi:hypothetical protein
MKREGMAGAVARPTEKRKKAGINLAAGEGKGEIPLGPPLPKGKGNIKREGTAGAVARPTEKRKRAGINPGSGFRLPPE